MATMRHKIGLTTMMAAVFLLAAQTASAQRQSGIQRTPDNARVLVSKDVLNKMYMLRRVLSPMGTVDAVEFLIDKLKDTKNNDDFFTRMNQ